MHYHLQTILAAPDGDCFSTCLACILELDPSTVPNFVGEYQHNWYIELQRWLAPMNMGVLVMECNHEYPPGYAILSCDVEASAQRHCVVSLDGVRIWDPSPIKRQIRSGQSWTILTVLDPAKPTNKEVYSRQF